jgi:hypothetical protein
MGRSNNFFPFFLTVSLNYQLSTLNLLSPSRIGVDAGGIDGL